MSDTIVITKAEKNGHENLLRELEAIESKCFSDPWSTQAFKDTIENPASDIYIAKNSSLQNTVGFCAVMHATDEAEILDIAVEPEMRRHGIGEKLLTYSITELKKAGIITVFLEVRASNCPAINLYEKFGFNKIGIRRGYYRSPVEDAILMKYSIKI